MSETTITPLPDPPSAGRRLRSNLPRGGFTSNPVPDVLRDGARKLIEQAIHVELAALMNAFSGERLEDGRARPGASWSFIDVVIHSEFRRQLGFAPWHTTNQVREAIREPVRNGF